METQQRKKWIGLAIGAMVIVGGYIAWTQLNTNSLPEGIALGNGRIEATEVDIAALTAGRIAKIFVAEGDFVDKDEILVQMDIVQLTAQEKQAKAELQSAQIGIETAKSLVRQAEAERNSALAVVRQREAALNAANLRLARSEVLVKRSSLSQQTLDDDRATALQAEAALGAAQASVAAADAAISAAKAQVINAKAAVVAAQAAIESVTASINDSTLKSPRAGRVQYLVAQEGEVVSSGGRVLNLVDLGDVYMTFFLPTSQAGQLSIGTEVRLMLDAAPEYVIPASVSYVADVAQFTPKTVETAEEREKLMFRIRAHVDPDLLQKYIKVVKTGLPGMAYVRIDPDAEWPSTLGTVVQ